MLSCFFLIKDKSLDIYHIANLVQVMEMGFWVQKHEFSTRCKVLEPAVHEQTQVCTLLVDSYTLCPATCPEAESEK